MKKVFIILLVSMTLFGFKDGISGGSELLNETITEDYENIYLVSKEVLSKVDLKKYEVKEVKSSQSVKELMTLLTNSKVELVLIKDSKNKVICAFTAMEAVYVSTGNDVMQSRISKKDAKKIKKRCQKYCKGNPPPNCQGTVVGLPSPGGGCHCMCIPDIDIWDIKIEDMLGPDFGKYN